MHASIFLPGDVTEAVRDSVNKVDNDAIVAAVKTLIIVVAKLVPDFAAVDRIAAIVPLVILYEMPVNRNG